MVSLRSFLSVARHELFHCQPFCALGSCYQPFRFAPPRMGHSVQEAPASAAIAKFSTRHDARLSLKMTGWTRALNGAHTEFHHTNTHHGVHTKLLFPDCSAPARAIVSRATRLMSNAESDHRVYSRHWCAEASCASLLIKELAATETGCKHGRAEPEILVVL